MKEKIIEYKEKIIEYLDDIYEALAEEKIVSALDLKTREEYINFKTAIEELTQTEELHYSKKSKKYILTKNLPNFRIGYLALNKGGFGFVIVGNDEKDIHINFDRINGALDGDKVLVELDTDNPEKREGRIVKIVDRNMQNIVGSIKRHGKELFFSPLAKINAKLIVDVEDMKECVEGEIVVAEIVDEHPAGTFLLKIKHHLCHKDDPTSDILVIAANNNIFAEFPDAVKEELESIPNEVLEEDRVGRTDRTNEMIFTIDGADTKDIDDAISLTYKDGFYYLGVHIADVSYYVKEGSALDMEAQLRGNSAYLADTVIPMLPHKLSNGICSLNEGVDRCAKSCIMKIDSHGKIVDHYHDSSIIRSCKKMTYTEVNKILEENIIPEGYEEYADTLKLMQQLAHILRENRMARGALNFDMPECKAICENGECVRFERRVQGEGEKLIEDFMIAANESIAEYYLYMNRATIFRVHDVPLPDRIKEFIQFCEITGHPVKGNFLNNISSKKFQRLMDQLSDVPESQIDIYHARAIRSMAKAVYLDTNIGHFGLASRNYLHFTSPIRRYADLMVHRMLDSMKEYSNLSSICKHISETEVNAQEAEREVNKMKMAELMSKHIGEEFDARVSGIVGTGLFVQLDNLVEGLVPLVSLTDDVYVPDGSNFFVIGTNSGRTIVLGDELITRCVNANKEKRQVDFEVVKVKKYVK